MFDPIAAESGDSLGGGWVALAPGDGDSFCEKCGFKKILRGPFDEYGLPLAPDEEACEYNLDHPADDRCPKHRAYLDLVESADELAGKIMNGGREI